MIWWHVICCQKIKKKKRWQCFWGYQKCCKATSWLAFVIIGKILREIVSMKSSNKKFRTLVYYAVVSTLWKKNQIFLMIWVKINFWMVFLFMFDRTNGIIIIARGAYCENVFEGLFDKEETGWLSLHANDKAVNDNELEMGASR